MSGQKPKWKLGNAVAVWDFGDRISIKLFNWDYISVPLNKEEDILHERTKQEKETL